MNAAAGASLLAILLAMAAPAAATAPSRQVVGYSGPLGEWEWTAKVSETPESGWTREFAGPLTLVHTGICTQDGPETKTGEIRFKLSRFTSEMKATIVLDGLKCSFDARLSDRYSGSLSCPDRPAIPLNIWLK